MAAAGAVVEHFWTSTGEVAILNTVQGYEISML